MRQNSFSSDCSAAVSVVMRWVAVVLAAAWARAAAGGARVAGTVRLGALFAVHGAPPAGAGACGPVREHYGIQRVEATLRALDDIAHSALLGSLRLGAELRDSCWAPPTALRQTIDLVRDALASSADEDDRCTRDQGSGAPLVGVLGPGASAAAAHVQNLLQLFGIPQISYSATAPELSDRARYSTFFRVVPSDRHQARLLVALLLAHNWTYVSAVHTDESYGQSGMAAFLAEASRRGVCVAARAALRPSPSPAEADAALDRVATRPEARVALCWCEGRTARALLAAIARRPPTARLRLLGSDGWADREDVVAGLEHAAEGSLTLRIRSPYLRDFDKYYQSLKPYNNTRNPWFREFWQQKFNCSLDDDLQKNGVRRCSGNESLAVGYSQEPKLALVVRGVYALAYALREMRDDLCPKSLTGLCARMIPFNVSEYAYYLQRVRFRAPDGGLVAFDDNGDPPAHLSDYDVMTLAGNASAGWRYERIATWRRGRLHLAGGTAAAARRALGWRALCSRPCAPGLVPRGGRCCWLCVPCPALAVTRRQKCRLCPPGHRPDALRIKCDISVLEWGEAGWARAASAASGGCGLVATGIVATALWCHRSTPIVKSASRELCSLLLGAAAVCHAAALAASARPSTFGCVIVRLGAPALAGVYAALLLRSWRILRLVEARGYRPRLVSARAAVAGWAALTAPAASTAAWAAWQWSAGPREVNPSRWRRVLVCNGEEASAQLVPLTPALVLLAGCTALAVRGRRLPRGFNEARLVGAAAYATGVAWAAFLAAHAAAFGRWAALSACVSLSAGAVVLLALGPRAWLCVCRPAANTRDRFLTASIRCHLGKYKPESANIGPDVAVRESCTQTECACASRVTQTPLGDGTLVVRIALSAPCGLHREP